MQNADPIAIGSRSQNEDRRGGPLKGAYVAAPEEPIIFKNPIIPTNLPRSGQNVLYFTKSNSSNKRSAPMERAVITMFIFYQH